MPNNPTHGGAVASTPDCRTESRNGAAPAKRVRTVLFWSICAALPVLLLIVLSIWGGTYPFGPESFLTEDLKYQYIDFFTWYREVLTGDANIFYSFAQGMGSNTWGLFSYYLASPFNLIILLFDEAHLTLAIYVIVALKLACMNVSMAWYLRRRFHLGYAWALALSICYTWSTWTATNLRNPLWLDALILLPLMAWCCYRLIRTGSFIPLALLVAVNVMSCWYMAYITLLFCCLFVLFELAVMMLDEGERPEWAWIAGRAGRFTAAIALGLGLSAWTFVPTVLAMMGGEGSQGISAFLTYPTALIRGFLPGAWNFSNTPQFYTGLIPLVLAVGLLIDRRANAKFRAALLVFAGFLVTSSVLGVLMYIWCGFRQPNGFYSRIAFLLSFLEIWAAAYLLMMRSARPAPGAHMKRRGIQERSGLASIACCMAVVAFAVADMGWNAHCAWDDLYTGYPQAQHAAYVEEVDQQTQEIRARDTDAFYRIDKTYNRAGAAFNEGISHGFSQLSTYSSAHNPRAVAFLNAMGYSTEGEFSSVYAAPNLVMDSLLGVRYIGTWGLPAGTKPTEVTRASNGADISYNPYALSLGFASATDLANSPMPAGNNPFERQNTLVEQLTGTTTPLYTPIEAQRGTNASGMPTWDVEVPAGTIGYVFVQRGEHAGSHRPVTLTIDKTVIGQEGWRFANNVRALGPVASDPALHTITISPASETDAIPEHTTCLFYALNMDVFEQVINTLKAGEFTPSTFQDGHVAGTYSAAGTTNLVLSIPYDNGWSATVDGHEAELEPAAGGALSTLALTAGEHAIELSYRSPGMLLGAAASTCALIIVGGCAVAGKRKRTSETQLL